MDDKSNPFFMGKDQTKALHFYVRQGAKYHRESVPSCFNPPRVLLHARTTKTPPSPLCPNHGEN